MSPHHPSQILIKFRNERDADRILNTYVPGSNRHRLSGPIHKVVLPQGASPTTICKVLSKHPGVEYAEPDFIISITETPNDPNFGDLWGLANPDFPGQDIHATEAWDIIKEAPDIIVAVIDSGARLTHEDLVDNLWDGPLGVHGFNALSPDDPPEDDEGHGTHVAGTIGAVGNNALGVVGVAWSVKLMILKSQGSSGTGATSDVIQCIEYARLNGANVINMSLAGPDYSQSLYDSISLCRDHGILVVAAAGNQGTDNDDIPYYPASFELDNIISVGATTQLDEIAYFSNWGRASVDLGAPGYQILSTAFTGDTDYEVKSGTSMAAPHVAGAVALLMAKNPSVNYAVIRNVLLETVDRISSMTSLFSTGGRLNLFAALSAPVPSGISVFTNWPLSVPIPYIDFSGIPRNTTLISAKESGSIQRRSRFVKAYDVVQATWVLNADQYFSFSDFFKHSLGEGTASFILDLSFPKNSELVSWVCRFGEGGYEATHESGFWRVAAILDLLFPEELPVRSELLEWQQFFVLPTSEDIDEDIFLETSDEFAFYVRV